MKVFRGSKARILVLLTTVAVVASPLAPAVAASKPVMKLKAVQSGFGAKLTWSSTKKVAVRSQKIQIACALPELTSCKTAALVGSEVSLKASARSRTISGLTPGVIYAFKLVSPQYRSSSVTMIVDNQLSAPRDMSAAWERTGGVAQVTVSWQSPVLYEGGFKVRAVHSDSSLVAQSADVPAGTTTYTFGDLDPSKSYRVEVFGSNSAGAGKAASVLLAAAVPAAMKDLTATVLTQDSVRLTWASAAPADTRTKVVIEAVTPGAARHKDEISVLENRKELVVDGLTRGSSYRFGVVVTNDYGSAPATLVSARTVILPSSPLGLTASVAAVGSVDLQWSAPTSDGGSPITDYVIEYGTIASGNWSTYADGVGVSTALRVNSLEKGTAYRFRVSARNEIGNSTASAAVNATTWGVPTAPVSLTATVLSTTSVRLNWVAPTTNGGTAVTDYQIQLSTDNGVNWNPYADEVGVLTTVTLVSLNRITDYQFRVRAVNAAGESAFSTVALAKTWTPPSAPTDLRVTTSNTSSVSLSWRAAEDDGGTAVTDYVIEFVAGSSEVWSTFSDGTSLLTSATVTGLNPGTTYRFRVRAVNALDRGAVSLVATTVTPVALPSAPSSLTATAGNGQVALAWTAPTSTGGATIDNYLIEMSTNEGISWSTITRPVSTSTSFTATGLSAGMTYYFRVMAVNSAGQSPYSNQASAIVLDIATAVQSLSVSATAQGTLTASWTAPTSNGGAAITDYVVEYSSNSGSTWTRFNDGVSTTTSAAIAGLTNGVSYQVRVRAVNSVGEGVNPAIVSATTWNVATNVRNVNAFPSASGQITVTWEVPSSNGGTAITGYLVNVTDAGSFSQQYELNAATLSLVIGELSYGTLYTAKVYAVNAIGNSPASGTYTDTATTWDIPGAPTALSLTEVNPGEITASWIAPVSDGGTEVTDYVIEIDSGTGFTVVNDGSNDNTTYVVTGLNPATTYTLRVRAVNAVGNSAWSATESLTTA